MNKYITINRYEGLDPELAELLKQGRTVKGYGWDNDEENKYVVWLKDYNNATDFKYSEHNEHTFKHFEPILQEEKLSNVYDIYARGGSIPINTEVWVKHSLMHIEIRRHFKDFYNSIVCTIMDKNSLYEA